MASWFGRNRSEQAEKVAGAQDSDLRSLTGRIEMTKNPAKEAIIPAASASAQAANAFLGAVKKETPDFRAAGPYWKPLQAASHSHVYGIPVRELMQHTYLIRRKQLAVEACFFALLMLVFFVICFTVYDVHKAFQTNDAFIDLFLDEEFEDANYKKNFYEIMTVEELWTWVKGPVVNGAYPDEWYNGEPFTPAEKGMVLYSGRLVGGVQLRQMRVRADSCKIGDPAKFRYPGASEECFGSFRLSNGITRGTDDQAPYGPNGTYQWTDGHHWLEGLFGYGPAYGSGGYVVQLPTDGKEAAATVAQLEANRWIDRGTRAVMVMMNFYNQQTDLVTVVRLLIEIFPSGHIVKSFKFYSFKGAIYDGTLGQGRIVFEILFVIGLLYFVGKEFKQMYFSPSVASYLSSPGNAFEVTLYVLVFLCAAYYGTFLAAPSRTSFQIADNQFRDIFALAERYTYIFTVAGFIGLLFTLKLFRYFSVSLQMQALFNTMMRAAPDLAAFLFGFVVLVGGFSFSGTMLWGATLAEYHNMASAFASLLRLSLGDFDYSRLAASQPVVTGWFFALYVTIVYLVAMNILIAIVTMYFEEVTRLLKQEEGWKQALPGFDSELASFVTERCRLCSRAPCCRTDDDADQSMSSPKHELSKAQASFDSALFKVMQAVERARGKQLEEFTKAIISSARPRERLFVSMSELRQLCRPPTSAARDTNGMRRCMDCICGRLPCAQRASELDDIIKQVASLYWSLKTVTMVGNVKGHARYIDTLPEVPARGDPRRYTVRKVNKRGVIHSRVFIVTHVPEEPLENSILNYNKQGYLRKRLKLTALVQIEEPHMDDCMVGMLFATSDGPGRNDSLIVENKDKHYLVRFGSPEEKMAFLSDVKAATRAVFDHLNDPSASAGPAHAKPSDGGSSSSRAKPAFNIGKVMSLRAASGAFSLDSTKEGAPSPKAHPATSPATTTTMAVKALAESEPEPGDTSGPVAIGASSHPLRSKLAALVGKDKRESINLKAEHAPKRATERTALVQDAGKLSKLLQSHEGAKSGLEGPNE